MHWEADRRPEVPLPIAGACVLGDWAGGRFLEMVANLASFVKLSEALKPVIKFALAHSENVMG